MNTQPTQRLDRRSDVRFVLLLLLAVALACKGYFDYTTDRAISITRPAGLTPPTVEDVVREGVKIRQAMNVPFSYAPDVKQEELSLDLFVRPDVRKAPILIYLHGGGWGGGDKCGIGPKSLYFARKGFAVASVNYRLGPVSPVHNGAEDVAAAIAYLRFIAPQIGADRDRIFIMGHSAGAHFGALVVCDPRYLSRYPGAADAIKGMILLDGSAYDLPQMMKTLRGLTFVNIFGTSNSGWVAVSPVHRMKGNHHIAPMLLVYAEEDIIRKVSAQSLADGLVVAGVGSKVLSMPNLDHGTVDSTIGSDLDELTQEILDFTGNPKGATMGFRWPGP